MRSEPSTSDKARLVEDIQQILKNKRTPKPGLSNAAKVVKDQLTDDPYNLNLIFELGCAYADDGQWNQCANVLLRGFKRVKEFEDPVRRFCLLVRLCEASYHLQKFRQAMAALNDIDESLGPDFGENKRYQVLKCQVFCANGDMENGIKAFHSAIEGENFDSACTFWVACSSQLQKVDAYELTKNILERQASNDEERSKVETMEKIAKLGSIIAGEGDNSREMNTAMKIFIVGVVLLLFMFLTWFLYEMEKKSFEKFKQSK